MTERQELVARTLRDCGPLAPPRLRAQVEADVARARSRSPLRLGLRLRPALAGAAAIALSGLAALALTLQLGGGSSPLVEAHEVAARGATAAAPPPQPGRPKLLARRVDGVAFPNWSPVLEGVRWKASGQRSDEIAGRRTATVFYEHTTHEIAYTILAGKALDPPEDARRLRVNGVDLYRFRHGGHDVLVFERGGRTCVVSGHVKRRSTLVRLASWRGEGQVAS